MEIIILIFFIGLILFLIIHNSSNNSKSTSKKTNQYNTKNNYSGQTIYLKDTEPIKVEAATSADSSKSKKDNYHWFPKDVPITIHGYQIKCGLIYVGEWLGTLTRFGYDCESSLINPKLNVSKSVYDDLGSTLNYWPVYSHISQEARASYLRWLSNGRNDESVNIGFVFLFFYGLERRILVDFNDATSINIEELQIIVVEIKRLVELHDKNNSFKSYANNLLDYINIIYFREKVDLPKENYSTWGEYPASFKFILSNFAINKKPLPHEIALRWLRYCPDVFLRTPANRCKEEFEALFSIKYQAKFGEGIILKPNKSNISVKYLPTSPSIPSQIKKDFPELPDLTRTTKYIEQFRQIASDCENDLEAYSRFLGKNFDKQASISALSLLPRELLTTGNTSKIDKIKNVLKEKIDENKYELVSVKELLKIITTEKFDKFSKKENLSIIQFLSKIGFGIEPDIRFGSPLLNVNDSVVLFEQLSNSPESATQEYQALTSIITFGIALSKADGNISLDEREQIIQHIEATLKISREELIRLKAFIKWAELYLSDLKGISKKLNLVNDIQKNQLINFLLALANADGYISPDEIKTLKKVYRLFNFNEDKLYSDLHSMKTGEQELITIETGSPYKEVYKIPEEEKIKNHVLLNENIIQKTLYDTNKVKAILTGIFNEDDNVTSFQQEELSKKKVSDHFTLFGLDDQHTKLFVEILNKKHWNRDEFESLCDNLEILPDGAIENINEVSYTEIGDDLIIGDQDLEINHTIIKNYLCAFEKEKLNNSQSGLPFHKEYDYLKNSYHFS